MKCLQCGKIIPQNEAKKIEEIGVEPFCSQYCAEVYGGVPLPYSKSDGFMDEVINGKY